MQSTTCFHDSVANPVSQEAYLVFDHPITFHPANRVLHADSDRRDLTIVCGLRWGEFTTTGLFLGLNDGDALARQALESPLLIETTPARSGIAAITHEGGLENLDSGSATLVALTRAEKAM